MVEPKFEGMAECTMCESGTFEPVEIFYSKTGYVTYCKRCWQEFGNTQPVDKSEDTPK
jgi:hypothetical protein